MFPQKIISTKDKKKAFELLLIFIVLFSVCLIGKLFFLNKIFFIVSSSSMEPEYPVGTLVIAKKTPFKSIDTGDVIVYKSDALNGGLAFHRITRKTEEGVYTKGDMNHYEDNQIIIPETYVAKGVYQNYALGQCILAIINPFGFIVFLVFPCIAIVLLYQIIKLILKNLKKSYGKL